jgi:opacity protein-like surface antigen
MNRSLAGFIAGGVLTLALAAPAQAQARGYVGLGAGLSIPTGDFKDFYKTGGLGQLVAGITGANGMLGGRIDGMYIRHSLDTDVVDGSIQLLGANANLVVTPGSMDAKLRPYILGGVGFFNGKEEIDGDESDGETKFAFNLGAGAQMKLSGQMALFLEARYLSIRTDDPISLIPIVLGLRWGGM